jgi:hypothetical protein
MKLFFAMAVVVFLSVGLGSGVMAAMHALYGNREKMKRHFTVFVALTGVSFALGLWIKR